MQRLERLVADQVILEELYHTVVLLELRIHLLHGWTDKLSCFPHNLEQRLDQVGLHLHDRRCAADAPDTVQRGEAQLFVVTPIVGELEETRKQHLYLGLQRREQHYERVERADDGLLLYVLLLVRQDIVLNGILL